MITPENIASHELIGLQTRIVDSSNKQINGLYGKIVDETKYTFTLDTKNGIKKIAKSSCHWKFEFNGQEKQLDGAMLTKRSFERVALKA
jgi:ribonuclease P protein subunit POP4